MKSLLVACALFFSFSGIAQSSIGSWITIDDKTKKQKSIVELYKKDSKMYGKIKYLFPREGRGDNPICSKCTDDRKNQPIKGLQIIRGLKWNGSEWEGGTIVDPENGKVYKVKIWVDSDNHDRLKVRGYAGIFYRTQTWKKLKKKK